MSHDQARDVLTRFDPHAAKTLFATGSVFCDKQHYRLNATTVTYTDYRA